VGRSTNPLEENEEPSTFIKAWKGGKKEQIKYLLGQGVTKRKHPSMARRRNPQGRKEKPKGVLPTELRRSHRVFGQVKAKKKRKERFSREFFTPALRRGSLSARALPSVLQGSVALPKGIPYRRLGGHKILQTRFKRGWGLTTQQILWPPRRGPRYRNGTGSDR